MRKGLIAAGLLAGVMFHKGALLADPGCNAISDLQGTVTKTREISCFPILTELRVAGQRVYVTGDSVCNDGQSGQAIACSGIAPGDYVTARVSHTAGVNGKGGLLEAAVVYRFPEAMGK